ncbi:unnamed protein product [Linum tenue]|uniref:Uncharacterized protein n=1 Tax=Linum tenue TaxID=586396 RepID=A0AAV0ING2_9ROSI|nr:unnamed protein product [Linum tenue]
MQYEAGEICVDSDAFRNLENLRILAIYNYDALPELVLPEDGLECLPETLRCLYWDFFPSRWFGSKFSPQNLVSLDLRHSNIEQLWEGAHNVDLGNLKYLNLRESQHLSKLPSFSTAKKLEWIDLEYCESLVELPLSIFYLPRLEVLLLRYCTSLNLTDLVGRYREEIGSQILPNLKKLDITGTATQKIPDFFCHSQIVELHCDNCPDMTEFPVIPSVKALSLSGTLIQGPIEVEFLYGLKELTCTDNRHLLCLSNGFCDLKSLERIDLSGCSQLKEFPDIMEPMGALLSVRLTGCSNLSTLPDSICNLTHLGELDLQNSGITELPSSIGDLIHLWHLGLACCTSLTTLPNTIHKLCKLVRLDLSNCILLTQLPELPSSLEHLNAHGCRSLRTVSCIEKHNLCTGKWSFGNCPELDPKSFRELVAKFTRDVEECHLRVPQKPTIILPAEGAMGEARRSSVLVELRQTWRLKGLIYWALLDFSCLVNIASAGVYRGHTLPGKYHVDCSIRNGGVDGGREDIVSRCELEAAVDDLAGGDGNRLLIMWYEDGFNGISFEGGEDENTTIFVEFFFRAGFPVRSKRMEMSNPIMSCGVLWQVYDDRVTYLS